MSQISFKGNPYKLFGELPPLFIKAPNFSLVDKDLKDRNLKEFHGKKKLIATVPSLDTGVCSLMTKHLNDFAKKRSDLLIITISADLPFAQKRFCQLEKTDNVLTLSMMRNKDFGKSYGLLIEEGPLSGLLARSLIILDEKDHIVYTELVSEITHEPQYERAFSLLTPPDSAMAN